MIVRILGSSAGGAFPQWNCACPNCARARKSDPRVSPRSQSQLAISADGSAWHLLNASPDLARQIEATPALHPCEGRGPRNTPIQSVVLTNADLDHVLGLLLMRESQPLRIHCSASVRRILLEDNSFFGMLRQNQGQTEWQEIAAGREFELRSARGEASGILGTPVALSDRYPRYVSPARANALGGEGAVVGLVLQERAGGPKMGYFPGVGALTPALAAVMAECSLLFVDGTFWTEDEMARSGTGTKTAAQMNHLPIPTTLELLATPAFARAKKVFIHINNTNPVLDESGPEHREVLARGWELGRDGAEYRL